MISGDVHSGDCHRWFQVVRTTHGCRRVSFKTFTSSSSCSFQVHAHSKVFSYRFDPHFNAITGLNGSGKSNILDAICFVLGITNLSQVRAGNLSELVYKQGQAGVNKAVVTIIFNNDDRDTSPVGYEDFPQVIVTRQVLLGGKSKYQINGRTVTANQVQNLFHSVQLNVNNPHFLIMQGRITKVLNMKPNEILGMVEEAAGTRMYETKRVTALKTITKKQLKLDELNAVLNEEITPTLERLRGEKEAYLQWSKNQADIARMERFFIASKFLQAQKALESNNEGSAEMQIKVTELEDEAAAYASQVEQKESEIDDASAQLRGDFEDAHAQAKATEEEHSKQLVKVTSSWQNSKANVQKAESDLQTARDAVCEIEQSVAKKQKEMEDTSTSIQSKVLAAKEADEKVAQLTTTYQNMSAGISTGDSDEGRTLPEQISKAHSDSKTAQAKVEQANMKIKHLTKELKVSFNVQCCRTRLVAHPKNSLSKRKSRSRASLQRRWLLSEKRTPKKLKSLKNN